MIPFTTWLEGTAVSDWVRSSPSLFAFPFILVVHAWGMGLLAGSNAALGFRVLGFAPRIPLPAMDKFYPVMWFGFVINAISGVLLLIAYPTKALTNPVFYLKLAFIAAGMLLMFWLRRNVVREWKRPLIQAKLVAFILLLFWAGAIVSGRLLAYTCRILMGDIRC